MTLDEAIKHNEEIADSYNNTVPDCDCAKEHRQLAELLKELKKLRARTRWTPVSEDLPEPWESVLITFSGKYGSLTADHAIGIGSWDDVNGWYFEDIEGYTDKFMVSAWQPMPDAYEGE